MADESEKNELIAQFTSVTGTDTQRAQFYLESSNWQLQFALSSFFDDEGDTAIAGQEDHTPVVEKTQKSSSTKGNSRIGTISSFSVEESDSDSDEEGQTFYAGGSEHSGQQIVGPPRKKKEKGGDDVTQSIFDAAKRHGAEVVHDETEDQRSEIKKHSAFRGSGYRLGDTEGGASVVNSESSNSLGPTETVEVTLTFWSNGFSVNNEPPRDLSAPENQEFLDSVKRGEIPRELLRINRGGEVHVNMVDKRHEEYVKPKETRKAFTGEGHKLGSPTPRVVGLDQSEATRTPSTDPIPPTQVDNTAPVTNLQIRLADGTRLVATFNHTHQISDVRNFVNASRTQAAGRHFVLMTTFPNKELTDETLTLVDAKLLNAVIIQRFK